jgi:hypothetical protein
MRRSRASLRAARTSSSNLDGRFTDRQERLLERLGPHKTGKSCLYVKRLADIDLDVLRTLVTRSMEVHRGQDRARVR